MITKCFQSTMAALCLALAASLCRPTAAALAQAGPAAAGEWQEFFDRAIPEQLNALHIAGAVVSVVEGDELVFAKGYGYADVENRIEVKPDSTLFRIGSITKLFTWTAVMQQVERGHLDLDADVNGYLDFHIPESYLQPVTLRHLMAHTAGFEDRVTGYQALTPENMTPLGEWLASHIPARVRAPGGISSYSNYGAALAGYIVERVSGLSYEDYLAKNILEPLGMEHTTVRQPLPEDWAADMSKGYVSAGGQFTETGFEYPVPFPTGGATSTAADMARFMSAHLQGGLYRDARILQENTAEEMHARLFGHDPRLNGFAYGFYEMSRNGLRVIGHEGATRLFHSLLALIPEKHLGVFVSYNTDTAFNAQYLLQKEFLDAFFPSVPDDPAKVIIPPAELSKFAGSYRQTRRFAETTVEKAGMLFEPIIVQTVGDGALRISSAWYGVFRFIPVEPLVFVQEDDPQNLLIFRKDQNGNVIQAFVGDDPATALEKLPWYADFTLHYILLAAGAGLFLTTLVLAMARWITARFRKSPGSLPKPAVIGRRIFLGLSAAGLLFLIGFVLAFNGIVYGELGLLNIVLALPVLLLVLSIAAGYILFRAWLEKYWHTAERIFYSLVLAVSVVFLWSLNYWNLLGWKY